MIFWISQLVEDIKNGQSFSTDLAYDDFIATVDSYAKNIQMIFLYTHNVP